MLGQKRRNFRDDFHGRKALMTRPLSVDTTVAAILTYPIEARLYVFARECLAHRERLRRDAPLAPRHLLTNDAKAFARIVLSRLQRAERQ